MTMPTVTGRCPHCGSERIREVCRITDAQEVTEWELIDGVVQPADYGVSITYYEGAERIGFDCMECEGLDFDRPDTYIDGVKVEDTK